MRPQIILFGDSITQQSFSTGGWGASLADNFVRKADVLNRGYGGYNTRWALFLIHQIFPLALEKPPIAVTIFFGANDAALLGKTSTRQHVPVEEYKENLRRIIYHVKECSPKMLVVLITPPPIDEDGRMNYARSLYGEKAMTEPERTNEVTGIYARSCIELANELNLPSINLWSKMQETEGWQKKFLSDGLHLTAEGNTVVYNEVVRVFSQAGVSSSDMPFDFPHHSQIDYKNPERAFQIQCSNGSSAKSSRASTEDDVGSNPTPETPTSMYDHQPFDRPEGIKRAKTKGKQWASTTSDEHYEALREREKEAFEHMKQLTDLKKLREARKLDKQKGYMKVKKMDVLLALMADKELTPSGMALKERLMNELIMD